MERMRTGGSAQTQGESRRRTATYVVATLCALLAGIGAAVAIAAGSAGGLDASFGTGGTTLLEKPVSTFPTPAALAPAGKIVVVSSGEEGATEKVFVSRLLPNGQPDPAFGSGGVARIEASSYIGAYAAAVQPDGKVVVVGYRSGGDVAMAWRLTASGAPDETFGVGGAAELSGGTFNYATAVAVAPDGKILVAGNSLTIPGPYHVSVWRLNVNGTLDPSFDKDGVAGISDAHEDMVDAIALQPDAKILVAGATANATSANDAVVWRLNADGGNGELNNARDPSFDVDGQADVDNGGSEAATSLAVQPDGRILMAGHTEGGPLGNQAVVWRLEANGGTGNVTNGALDTRFGDEGFTALGGLGNYARASALQLQPDGKILAAGEQKLGTGPFEAVTWRLGAGGVLDPSFGTGGAAAVQAGTSAAASALALQPDRRIVVAGTAFGAFGAGILVYRELGDPFSLHVVKAGAGTGTVHSAPTGIECGAACSALMNDGSEIGLSAAPAAGSSFTGWSGSGCAGTGGCTVTMGSDQTVTAAFDPVKPATPLPSHAPSLTSAKQSHRTWREGRKLASLARTGKTPVGTTFSFELDQPATVRLAFTQSVAGRRANGKCVPPTPRNRRRQACKRTVTRGVVVLGGHAELNKILFQGLLARSKKLPLGSYTLLLSATNGARQRSAVQSLRFTIVK